MPAPSSSLATLRPDLGGCMEEFDLAMDRQGFIGLQVLPVKEVNVQAGSFGIIPIEQLLKKRTTQRAPGSAYARGDWKFEPGTFATKEEGLEGVVDDREAKMYANYFDAELATLQLTVDGLLREFETAIADQIFNATTWTPTAVTNEWDDFTNATPISDVNARVKAMWEATGIWANSLIINKRVFRNLRQCDDITEKIRSVDHKFQGEVGIEHLRQAFDLPNIIIAGSAKNSVGEPNLTIAPVWSDEYAAVARIAETDNIKEPCVGRTFHWGEDGSSIGGTVESYREENVRGNVVRCRLDVDRKILYTAALQLLSNITT